MKYFATGEIMPKVSISKLFQDNAEALKLGWTLKLHDIQTILDSEKINHSTEGLIGNLNLTHPNWIQIFSKTEAHYFSEMSDSDQKNALEKLRESGFVCLILSDGETPPDSLFNFAKDHKIPIIKSPLPSQQIIWVIRTYLGKALAEFEIKHGVFLDVLGMGVMITGGSGVGKSELGLELISRGSGLVADDVVELHHIAPQTLEGRSPSMLKDFLEVRGLGMLNIRTIFGETAVRRRKTLKLIVQLEKPTKNANEIERIPIHAGSETILEVTVNKVQIPVAAGRNLAVLVEAAVRNYILQLRGIDSTQDFVERQENKLKKR